MAGTWCQFSLGGRKHRLPVVDERLVEAKDRARDGALTRDAVVKAIGGAPRYLVVALGAPHRGQAPKLVLGVLPEALSSRSQGRCVLRGSVLAASASAIAQPKATRLSRRRPSTAAKRPARASHSPGGSCGS